MESRYCEVCEKEVDQWKIHRKRKSHRKKNKMYDPAERSNGKTDRVTRDLEEVASMDDQDRAMLPVLLCGLHNVMYAQLSAGLVRVGGSE
jgi:hypothetical protein